MEDRGGCAAACCRDCWIGVCTRGLAKVGAAGDLDRLCHYRDSAVRGAVGEMDGRDLHGDDEADHYALGYFPASGARPAAQPYLGHSDGEGSERSPVRVWNFGLADFGR